MNKKVLIADDEFPIRSMIKYILEAEGFEVIEAKDGEEAINLAKTHLPDLIILDIIMPKFDGFEVCKNLKEDEKTKNIPIFMVTAKGQEIDEKRGLELGAEAYITKPFSPKKLAEDIKKRLSNL